MIFSFTLHLMYTEQQLAELEQYFISVTLPAEIRLSQCENIVDVKKFINAELSTCRANMSKTFEAAYDRLVTLKKILSGEISEPRYFQFRGFIDAHNNAI